MDKHDRLDKVSMPFRCPRDEEIARVLREVNDTPLDDAVGSLMKAVEAAGEP